MPSLEEELDAELAGAPPAAGPAIASTATALDAELDAELSAPLEPAPAVDVPPSEPLAPRRVNMLAPTPTGGFELVNVGEEHVQGALRDGWRLDASEADYSQPVSLLEQGRVSTYDPEEARSRLAQGAVLARPAELEQEYGDVGSQVASGLEGVAQGASMGLYGLAADAVGGQNARAERKLREEMNPVTSVGGNIVGAVGAAVLSGGTGAAAQAARVISPAARLANLSTRLGAAIAPRVATSTAGRIGLAAAMGAGEGAIDNAARQVFDDLGAGNVDGFAERALDAAWEGAKWGGAFGAGAGVIGEAADRIGQRLGRAADDAAHTGAADELTPADAPDAPPGRPRQEVDADLDAAQQQLAEADAGGNPQVIEEAEDRIAALIQEQEDAVIAQSGLTTDATIEGTLNVAPGPEAQGILARLDQNLNKVKNAQELKFKLKDEADRLAVSVESDLDNLQRFQTNTFDTYTNRSNKPKVIKAQLEKEGVVWTHAEAGRWLSRVDKMESVLNDMTTTTKHAVYSPKQLKDFEAGKNALKKLREHITGLKDAGPITPSARILGANLDAIAETIHAADLFKTHLGGFARSIGARPATTSEATFQRLYMGLRADLQNPKMVGKGFAEFQTVSNAAITRAIRKADNFQRVAGRVGTSEGGGQFGFADVTEYDAKKLGAIFDNLADPRAHKDARDFIAGLTSKVELMETQAKYYPMPAEALAEIKQARDTLASITEKMRATQDIARKSAEATRLAAQTSNLQTILEGIRNIPVGGAAVATVAGGVKGLAASVVSMAKGAVKAEKAIDDAVKATVKNNFTGRLAPELKAAGPRGGVGIGANAVRRAIEDARDLQDPESERSQAMAAQIETVRQESPELADAIAAKVMGKAEFILSKIPSAAYSDPFGHAPLLMDEVTEQKLQRYVSAARDPSAALKRFADGAGSMEDVETMRALYPQRFQAYRDRLLAQVAAARVPPTLDQRSYLHMVTGEPMSLEQRPDYVQGMQQLVPPAEQEQPQAPTPRESARAKFRFGGGSFGSRSDQILGETLDS